MGMRLILPPVLFVMALFILRLHLWLRDAWRTRFAAQTGRLLQITGGVIFGLGGVAISVLAIIGMTTDFGMRGSDNEFEMIVALSVYLAVPLTIAGFLVVLLGGRIGRGLSVADSALLEGLRIMGWILFALAFISILPIWALVLVPVPLSMLFLMIRGNQNFERQRQLMSLIKISIQNLHPLPDEIAAFARGRGGQYRRQLTTLEQRLREGNPLPNALARVPGLFPQETIDTIQLAAASHSLDAALPRAALLQEARLQKRSAQKMRFANVANLLLSYLLVIGLVVGFLMYWIIPKYKAIFDGFGMYLPMSTVTLIHASDWLTNYFWLFFLIAIGFIFWSIGSFQRRIFSWLPDSFLAAGRFLNPRGISQALLDQLTLMTANAIPISSGLQTLAKSRSYAGVSQRILDVARETEQGGDTWDALRRNRLITTAECSLLQAAQNVGNLPWTLEFIANSIEQRTMSRLELLRITLHTCSLLLIGGIVAWISIGFFSPLLSMLKGLS